MVGAAPACSAVISVAVKPLFFRLEIFSINNFLKTLFFAVPSPC